MNNLERRGSIRLKCDLKANTVNLGAIITLNSPTVAEILGRIGLDWLWIEMEHSALCETDVLAMLQATNGSNVSTVIRVPWNDKTMIKRALDLGPDGIVIPLVNSKQEALDAVRAVKYPPMGERGAGLGRAQFYGMRMDDYLQTANASVTTIVMIEHIKAVENIRDILQVPGVDSVMIGTLDLSGSLGVLGNTADSKVEGAVQEVLAACKEYQKPCGILALSPEQANERIAQGFTNLVIGIDVMFLHGAVRESLERVMR